MPNCKQCQKPIPARLKIGDTVHNICHRVYCFECSPFGMHNTRKLTNESTPLKTLLRVLPNGRSEYWNETPCKECTKPLGKSRGVICRSCQVTLWRKRMKLKALAYMGGECTSCGFKKYAVSLEFHHIDPSQKDFSLSGVTIAWERMKKELEKCVLLCANCHRAVHSGELEIDFTRGLVPHG